MSEPDVTSLDVDEIEGRQLFSEPYWTVPRQPAALTVFKYAGVLVSSVLLWILLIRLVVATVAGSQPWVALPALPALFFGYLCADLLSGTTHWFCDTFFDEETPVIGKILIEPFREHHVHPQRITRCRFIEQDTTNFFVMLPPLALAFWNGAPSPGSGMAFFWCSFLVGISIGLFGTNLFHKWAHTRKLPAPIRWLQRNGLILGPERHQCHHGDFSRGFCVTSGWMNPVLDALRFFPRLETAIRTVLQRPKTDPVSIDG